MKRREDYVRELFPEVLEIQDNELQAAVIAVWKRAMDLGGWAAIQDLPFTLVIPNVTESLVSHVRVVTQMCLKVVESIAPRDECLVNRDYLLSGALLHDVGKLIEYEKREKGFGKSQKGDLLRHPFVGACLALDSGLPYEVAHIIATHSNEGNNEKRSCESIIVHYCDFVHFDLMKNKYGK